MPEKLKDKDKSASLIFKTKHRFNPLLKLINKFPHLNKRLIILILIILAIPLTVGIALIQQELRSGASGGERKIVFGVYGRGNDFRGTAETDTNPFTAKDIKSWSNEIGGDDYFPQLILLFASFQTGETNETTGKVTPRYLNFDNDNQRINDIIDQGGVPIFTWMPKNPSESRPTTNPEIVIQDIIDGKHDPYIKKYAKDIVKNKRKFIIRLAHEMNLNFPNDPNPWARARGTDGKQYIAMYRHIVNIFKDEGARKYVKFEWCPGKYSPNQSIADYYPGDKYVDYLGFDSYGKDKESMYDLFLPTYYELRKINKEKPIIVTETNIFGDTEEYIADWWSKGIEQVYNQMPQIKAVIQFRVPNAGRKLYEVDRAIINNPKYQGTAQKVLNFPANKTFPSPTPNPIPTNPPSIPKGNHGSSSCSITSGWTCDGDNFNQALQVHIYKDGPAGGGGTMIANVTANVDRQDLIDNGNVCGGTKNHGFNFTIPQNLKDGQSHKIYAYAINIGSGSTNPLLGNSPKTIQCAVLTPRPTSIPTPTRRPSATPTPRLTSTPTPRPTSAPTPTPNPGDFNGDGTVDINDFNIWRDEFLGRSKENKSDANKDGKVDLADYIIWRNHL